MAATVEPRSDLAARALAALVSRCGEKDLFDLLWILQQQELSIAELLEAGEQLDGGVNGEAVLESLTGAQLSAQACGFGLRDELLASLSALLHARPAPSLSKEVRKIRRWSRG